ncbi:hypothetical protein GTH32_06390 [Alteromonas sp. 345S023]|uniref:Uncharacterized protein n=1 Tax=Alteromonas profundi TaxID=2696062 RepID=A0A7X5RKB6_9ALTE|nr:hypothetical protein [Alteromonas profundi]NDV90828.1 hypothetical protein [Alteromonas profundi]
MPNNTPVTPTINPNQIIWVLLSGAMALTFIVMLFLPQSGAGEGMVATYSSMLWCGIFGATLMRYLARSGWVGFAMGSALGFFIHLISQVF